MRIKGILSVWKKVFTNWKYLSLALFIMLVFYMLDILFANFREFLGIFSVSGFFGVIKVFPMFMATYKDFFSEKSFIGLIIVSFMIGILFSLIAYKTKIIKSASGKAGIFASLGIFLGIFSPSCGVACGVGILSVLGISSAVMVFLSYWGFWLIVLSVGILSFSIYKISRDIDKGFSCDIKINTT